MPKIKTLIVVVLVLFNILPMNTYAGMDLETLEFLSSIPAPCENYSTEDCPDSCEIRKGCFGNDICTGKIRSDPNRKCGESGYYGQAVPCCEGLSLRCGRVEADDTCSKADTEAFYCIPCGNGLCDGGENKCNCAEDCKPTAERPKIKYAPSEYHSNVRPPDIGVVYDKALMQEDVPAKLMEAYKTSDASICDRLLDIKVEQRSGDDYSYYTPAHSDYVAYCRILAIKDASLCKTLQEFQGSCNHFFQTIAEAQNDNPQFCYQQYQKTFFSVDEIRNCYYPWIVKVFGGVRTLNEMMVAENIEPFTQLDFEILKCVYVDLEWRGDTSKPTADQCFSDLNLKYPNSGLEKFKRHQ